MSYTVKDWFNNSYGFVITYVLSCLYFSINHVNNRNIVLNVILGFITMIVTPFMGYLTHILFHKYDFQKRFYDPYYKDMDAFTKVFFYYNVKLLDFHNKIHHSKKGITLLNEFIESILNILSQSWLLFVNMYSNNYLNNKIIIFWSLIYVTVHLINYNINNKLRIHRQHHQNQKKNYEPYIFDIIFNTAYKGVLIESYNHIAINVLVLFVIIEVYSEYVKK
jgi:sterol desaturase/sphingolipid hydroxylase (fatty acid hydroxylase superfamily)